MKKLLLTLLGVVCGMTFYAADAMSLSASFDTSYTVTATRCDNGPIFDRDDGADNDIAIQDGGAPSYDTNLNPIPEARNDANKNINGPSVIWFDDPVHGQHYYMAFAHHEGRSIRLAYADDPCFNTNLKVIKNPNLKADENNLSYFNNGQPLNGNPPLYNNGISDNLDSHVASPDLHFIDGNLCVYVHGDTGKGQSSLLLKGTNFGNLKNVGEHFAQPYLKFFQVNSQFYAVMRDGDTHTGLLYRNNNNDCTRNFTKKASLINDMRHAAVYVDGTHVLLFFSKQGDNPERIRFLDLNTKGRGDPGNWKRSNSVDVLKPEKSWEGAGLNTGSSKGGVSYSDVEELRDPAIFVDPNDNQIYLYYTIRGEAGIAAAKLTITK